MIVPEAMRKTGFHGNMQNITHNSSEVDGGNKNKKTV